MPQPGTVVVVDDESAVLSVPFISCCGVPLNVEPGIDSGSRLMSWFWASTMPAAPGSDFTPFDALSPDTALGLKFAPWPWSVDGEAVRGICVVDIGLGFEVEFS